MPDQDSLPRRSFLLGTAAGGLVVTGSRAAFGRVQRQASPIAVGQGRSNLPLTTSPVRVFKALDLGKERTESWYFHLVLKHQAGETRTVDSLDLTVRSGLTVLSRHTLEGASLAAIRIDVPVAKAGGEGDLTALLLRVRGSAHVTLKADSMECLLRGAGSPGAWRASTVVKPQTYEQRTKLVFPFRGHGVVTQGGVHNGGHSNRSGQFAVDAIGLTTMYSPQVSDDDTNEAAVGWGREIIAPAPGIVGIVRDDRPDQPVIGAVDPKFLLMPGDPGNHVVIDHENGEFSMIAHMQAGTVRVREGQRVAAGDVMGRLGNSGETNFPHVHYQLMDGKDWLTSDALPCRFTNMPADLSRGTWFNAK